MILPDITNSIFYLAQNNTAGCSGIFPTITNLIQKGDLLGLTKSDTFLATLNKILSGIAYLGFLLLNWAINVFRESSIIYLDADSLTSAWRQIIFFVNIFALFMIIAIALLNALRINIQTYAIKKTLPNLIAGIIFANLSFLFCLAILDFNDVLASFFLYTAGGADKVAKDLMHLLTFQQYSQDTLFGPGIGKVSDQIVCDYTSASIVAIGLTAVVNFSPEAIAFVLIGIALLTILFLMLPAILFGILAIIMLIRRIIVFVLIALAPLGVLFYFFPATRGIGEKWLNTYVQWVFIPAVVFFIVSLATIFVNANFNLTTGIQTPIPAEQIDQTVSQMAQEAAEEAVGIGDNTWFGQLVDAAKKLIGQQSVVQFKKLSTYRPYENISVLDANLISAVDHVFFNVAHAQTAPAPSPSDPPSGGGGEGGGGGTDPGATPSKIDVETFFKYLIGIGILLASIYIPFTTGSIGTGIVNSIAAFAGGPVAKEGLARLGNLTGISGLERVLPGAISSTIPKSTVSKDLMGIAGSALTGSNKMSSQDLNNQWNFLRTPQALAAYNGPDGVRQQMVRTNQMRKEFFDQEMTKQAGKGSGDLINQLKGLDANGDVQNFLNQRPLRDPSKLNEIGALFKTLDNRAKNNDDLSARKFIEEQAGLTNKNFAGSPELLKMNQFESLHDAIDKVIKDPSTRQGLKDEFSSTGQITKASNNEISQIMNIAKENFGEQPWPPVTENGRVLSLDKAHQEFNQAVTGQTMNNYKANSAPTNNQPLRAIRKQINAGDFDAAIKTANANGLGGMAAQIGRNVRRSSAERAKFDISLDNMIKSNDSLQNQTPISMKASDHMTDIMSKLADAKKKNNLDDIAKYTAYSGIVGDHEAKINTLKKDPKSFNAIQDVIMKKGGQFTNQKELDLKNVLNEIPKSVSPEYVQQIMPEVKITNTSHPYDQIAGNTDIESLLKTRFNYIAHETPSSGTTTIIKEVGSSSPPPAANTQTIINEVTPPATPPPSFDNIEPPKFNPLK